MIADVLFLVECFDKCKLVRVGRFESAGPEGILSKAIDQEPIDWRYAKRMIVRPVEENVEVV